MTSSFDLNFYSEGGSIRRGELQRVTGTREDAGPGDHQCDVFRRTHLCAAAREFLLLLSEQFERCEIRIQRTAHHRFIIDVLENVMSGIGTNRFSKIFRQCTPRPAVRRSPVRGRGSRCRRKTLQPARPHLCSHPTPVHWLQANHAAWKRCRVLRASGRRCSGRSNQRDHAVGFLWQREIVPSHSSLRFIGGLFGIPDRLPAYRPARLFLEEPRQDFSLEPFARTLRKGFSQFIGSNQSFGSASTSMPSARSSASSRGVHFPRTDSHAAAPLAIARTVFGKSSPTSRAFMAA